VFAALCEPQGELPHPISAALWALTRIHPHDSGPPYSYKKNINVGIQPTREVMWRGKIEDMEPELLEFVTQAADIAASGRWEAVNARIKALVSKPGVGNKWWVQLFASLCFQAFSEYLCLKRAYHNREIIDAPLLAWRARNLLELSVWSMYCTLSRENARRVYEDAGRDVRGIYDTFLKWGSATGKAAEWLDPLSAAKRHLAQQALDVSRN
jgi:hypothetical protein